jgi:hypothetical protein
VKSESVVDRGAVSASQGTGREQLLDRAGPAGEGIARGGRENPQALEQVNAYLESEYLPEWNEKFVVAPACGDNAHRLLGKEHVLEAIVCPVESHVIASDYTIRHQGKTLQIAAEQIRPRMRGAAVRVEPRHNGEIAVRFEGRYLSVKPCDPAPKVNAKPVQRRAARQAAAQGGKSKWMDGFGLRPGPTLKQAIAISNATT